MELADVLYNDGEGLVVSLLVCAVYAVLVYLIVGLLVNAAASGFRNFDPRTHPGNVAGAVFALVVFVLCVL